MPPVVNPVATIPYEIASDIEYAERQLASFERWSFNDHNRAAMNIITAVDTYGRVWGKLGDRTGFSMGRGRPYNVQICHALAYQSEPLPTDPVVDKAVEVAVAFAEFCANPLASLKGVDKQTLHSEMARSDRLHRLVKDLGDLVRERVQEDYVRLQPGDWVRVSYWRVVGRVAAVRHCRVRVTTAERLSSFGHAREYHRYTSWDLVRNTLEKIFPPEPLPLCVPGLEWFHKAADEHRKFEFYADLSEPHLLRMHTHAQQLEFAVNMLFLCEYPSQVDITLTRGLTVFPEEFSACFPEWMETRLRAHYDLAGQLGKHAQLLKPPPWEESARLIQALRELGREMIDALAPYIADQVGRETGAQLNVYGDYVKVLRAIPWDIDEEDEDDDEIVRYQGRSATLVKHSGRTLTVEFDPHEKLPGPHEVDISEVRA